MIVTAAQQKVLLEALRLVVEDLHVLIDSNLPPRTNGRWSRRFTPTERADYKEWSAKIRIFKAAILQVQKARVS